MFDGIHAARTGEARRRNRAKDTPAASNPQYNAGPQIIWGTGGGGGDYAFGPIPGLPPVSFAGNSVNEALGNLAGNVNGGGAGAVQTVYQYLTGSNQFPSMADMLYQIGRAWSQAGGAKGRLVDIYRQGSYQPNSSGGGGGGATPIMFNMGGDGGVSAMRATAEQSAYGTVTQYLQAWNLMGLAPLAMQLIADPGNHLNADEVMQKIRTSPEYEARFPGLNDMRSAGRIMTEQDYSNAENDIIQKGQWYGLPDGFLNPQKIGDMIKNGIYGDNLKARLDAGYAAAINAPPQTRALLKEYFGVDTGALAAYYTDPKSTAEILTKNWQAAQIGGAAIKSGWGDPGKNVATELAAQARDSSLSMDYFRQGFAKAEQMAPLESTQLGMRGQATASKEQILGSVFTGLNQPLDTSPAENQVALQAATEARTAGLRGGGGFAQAQKGVVGVGRAGTEGIGNA